MNVILSINILQCDFQFLLLIDCMDIHFHYPPPPNSPKNINMHFMVKSQFPIVKSDLCKYQKYRINTEKENTQLEYNITANVVLIYKEIKSF